MSETKQLNLWKVITLCAAAFTTGASGGWVVGRTVLKDKLEAYEKAERWHLPDAIKEIERTTIELEKHLTIFENVLVLRKQNEKLKSEREKYLQENIDLLLQVNTLKKHIKELEKNYAEKAEVVIDEATSVEMFDSKLIIGVNYVFSDFVSCTINNQDRNLKPGEFHTVCIGSLTYRVSPTHITVEVNNKKVAFTVWLMK